jgi:hypothetical protein
MIITIDLEADINAYEVCDEITSWLSDLYKCKVRATTSVWAESGGMYGIQEKRTEDS